MTILETERLLLRPPHADDLGFFVASLNDDEIARTMTSVPHPYGEADALAFIAMATRARAAGEAWVFTIVSKASDAPVGAIGLHLHDGRYELGYWIARPYWGRGFATEAGRKALEFAFGVVRAELVEAGWFHDNPASGRVLGKLGFAASHVEPVHSRARGESALCNRTMLTRERFGRKRAA